MEKIIAVKKGEDEYETTLSCLKILKPELKHPVLIKPNFVRHTNYPKGCITEPKTIKAVIDYVGNEEIWIGEGGFSKKITELAFKKWLEDIAKDYPNVKIFNFFDCEAVKLGNIKVAKPVVEAGSVVSLAKMKCHNLHYVTLSGKNLMGCLIGQRRVYFHTGKALASLISLLNDNLNIIGIIDGIVGSSLCEVSGIPIRGNVVLSGNDIISLDAFAVKVMGLNISDVPIFKYLNHDENIIIKGDKAPTLRYDKPLGWGL